MKIYTQKEFDALPIIDGYKQCPTGTEIKALQYLGFANIVAATWSPEEIEK